MVFAYPLQPMPRNMDPFSEFMSWANSAFKAFRSMPGKQHKDPISLGNTKRCTWNNNKITVALRYTVISCSLQSLHWTNLMTACCQRSVGMWPQIQVGRQVEMLAACIWRLHATLHDHQNDPCPTQVTHLFNMDLKATWCKHHPTCETEVQNLSSIRRFQNFKCWLALQEFFCQSLTMVTMIDWQVSSHINSS